MTRGRRGAFPPGKASAVAVASALLFALASAASAGAGAETLTRGRQIYRDGTLPSGRPLTATVQGDAILSNRGAACVSCHQRSGLGTVEASTVIPAITGSILARPATSPSRRPAYTKATLARAIREGVDPTGRPLHPLMPRYALPDEAVDALHAYLETLSAHQPPGVSERAVHFATVVAADVPAERRDAMLDVLDGCVEEAAQLADVPESVRRHGPSRSSPASTRHWTLSRWVLTGPPDTWPAQLDRYYRERPAFAMLSGISAGDWRTVHDFCERHEIPCLLPNTPLPVPASDDFYTLYLSKGLVLEAQVLAAHLSRAPPVRLLQVFRTHGAGELAASALKQAVAGYATVVDWPLPEAEPLNAEGLATRMARTGSAAAVLWLPREAWSTLGEGRGISVDHTTLYASSTLLGGDPGAIPGTLRHRSLLIHSLAPQQRIRRVESWLAAHGRVPREPMIQAQTYLACLIASEGLKRSGNRLDRDRFLEMIDRVSMAPMGSGFPRPDFAPGRRYLINGAYVLEVGEGAGSPIRSVRWVVP